MSEELPYKCEYAKSGRASCKGCKNKIDQGVLRLAVMVQVNATIFFFFSFDLMLNRVICEALLNIIWERNIFA